MCVLRHFRGQILMPDRRSRARCALSIPSQDRDAESTMGTMDLVLSLVYSALFVALLALSYLSIWRRRTRN